MIFTISSYQALVAPLPVSYVIDDSSYINVSNLTFYCTYTEDNSDCQKDIQNQIDLYTKIMFPKQAPTQSGLSNVYINIENKLNPHNFKESHENYTLVSNTSGIYITAYDKFACSRALATLSQLIESPTEEQLYVPGIYAIQSVTINDYPKTLMRALLIDSSRHFLSLEAMKRQVVALAIAKQNVLHIHIIDSQSNSFAAETYPASDYQKACYNHGHCFLHSMADMTELSLYANSLGVFIMIEYDMPGHAQSWALANSNLVAQCPNSGSDTINPLYPQIYDYIRTYIQDLKTSVYDPVNQTLLLHLGGDEVNTACWMEDQNISNYMTENGLSVGQLWSQFHQNVIDVINNITTDNIRVYWQESYENGNNVTGAIVDLWYSNSEGPYLASQGQMIKRSQGLYLDQQQPGSQRYAFQETYKDFYGIDAYAGISKDKYQYVVGIAGCQWGERVHDNNIDEQVWPRELAVAENGWSDIDHNVTDDVIKRLNGLACKLRQAGINTGALMAGTPCVGDDGYREF